jgi:hypothetical protein
MKADTFRKVRMLAVAIVLLALAASDSQALNGGNALADNIPQSGVGDWRDTGVVVQEKNYRSCLDGKHPDVLFVSNNTDDIGTVAYDLGTGERTVVNKLHYDDRTWGKNGFLYASDDAEEPANGQHYTVQYFQRAELELHPENAGTANEVLLSQLGTEQFNVRYDGGVAQP